MHFKTKISVATIIEITPTIEIIISIVVQNALNFLKSTTIKIMTTNEKVVLSNECKKRACTCACLTFVGNFFFLGGGGGFWGGGGVFLLFINFFENVF